MTGLKNVSDDDGELMIMNCFCCMVDRRKILFPAVTIVRDSHDCESPTRSEQNLSLCRT